MSEYSVSAKPNGLRKSLHDVGLGNKIHYFKLRLYPYPFYKIAVHI
jgi:hypothetical protein